ncbi:MAG: phosphopantetheine-binding protein, partial [Saccharospirillaceae bacterium]|nr:phosphopantetheine-binding protein [Saccharospirillaceae bacterium]
DCLRAQLQKVLPEYMVPNALVAMDGLPLSANGKVDRKQLSSQLAALVLEEDLYESPEGEVEEQLAAIWCDILTLERVSRNDNFFMIGGDSLSATQIVELIQKQRISPVPVSLNNLFSLPSVATLGAYITEQWQLLGVDANDTNGMFEEGIL